MAADAPTRRDERRPRLNLALVLDRSGSMEERGKMAYAREAARMMVDMLGPDDRLAVIEYDDEVTVLWPSAPVESPSMLKRRIDALVPRGSTDLFGGMMAGVEQVLPHRERADIDRVVLLSDGLANSGVTDLDEIVHRVGGQLRLHRESLGDAARLRRRTPHPDHHRRPRRGGLFRPGRVVVEANLIEADCRLDGIVRMYENGDLSEANTSLEALTSDINAVNQSTPDKRLAAKLEALSIEREDMAAAAGDARAASAFVKQRKANCRLGAKGKQQYLILSDRDKGPEVERLQAALREAGVYDGPVDGLFGDALTAALKTFQRREGLTVDGLAGPRTQRALGLY